MNPKFTDEDDGIEFDCPTCKKERIWVPFSPTLKGEIIEPTPNRAIWNRTGDTFETLTLTPSIDYNKSHWHGFITNGEVT